MATYRSGDFKKGIKVQIDGEPYLMSEMNFRKPGKGNALYECTLKNLIRGTTLKRVFRGGDELEAADVEEVPCQYLYAQQDTYFFMNSANCATSGSLAQAGSVGCLINAVVTTPFDASRPVGFSTPSTELAALPMMCSGAQPSSRRILPASMA